MPTLTVKNIPDDLYEQLKMNAATNHRSINSEIIACIESAVRSRKVKPEQMIARARTLRERSAAYRITQDEFDQAKNEGRP